MKITLASGLAVVLGAAITGSVVLAESHVKENPAVEARHHQMNMIAYHTGVLGAVAKGEMEYDAAMVSAAATNLAALANMERAVLWIEGTEQGAAPGSRAKAEIWSGADDFAKKFEDLATAASALVDAPDAAAVGAGMGAVGESCKACHETYRGPKN